MHLIDDALFFLEQGLAFFTLQRLAELAPCIDFEVASGTLLMSPAMMIKATKKKIALWL